MEKIAFTKMHGLGNCYVYIDASEHNLPERCLPELARRLSNVSTGIGSDGMILIGASTAADVQMRIFNKDGSEGKNCGNGLRCVARYAYDKKLVKSKSISIETLSGIVQADLSGAFVKVDMGVPRLARSDLPMVGPNTPNVISEPFMIDGSLLNLTAVSMGNPHAVFFTDTPEHDFHKTLGPKIEKDLRFPERVNVEFVYVNHSSSLHFRVWERGSGITQACGTGACAAVVAAVLNGFSKQNEEISVHLEGGSLHIEWQSSGHILMTGPAEYIASGIFETNFS